MKIRVPVTAAGITFAMLLLVGVGAGAAELKVLGALAMQPIMEDLGPRFERATGHKLSITFATMGVLVKRIEDGEVADVVIVPRQGVDRLVKEGKATADNVTILAVSGMGVVVRQGAPKPDISSPEALKRTLLAAQSIAYTDPAMGGTSGAHFAKVLDRLGIVDEVKAKTVFPKRPGGPAVGALVASGEAEIGIQQIQELIPVSGIDIVGPLPGELQNHLVFAAVVMAGAKDAEASKALVRFLRAPEAAAVIKSKGMEPAIR
jgi:molybdate transport system substrate-binding protein